MGLFNALPARKEGVGPYRINRYRVYFRPFTRVQRDTGKKAELNSHRIATTLAQMVKGNFPRYFNPNLARVYSRSEQYNNHNTLRFILSAGLFGSEHPIAQFLAPDCHADWVGIHCDHSNGFTVQTLRRNFFTGLDAYLASVSTGIGAASGGLYSAWAGPGAAIGAGGGALIGLSASAAGMYISRSHFLAGRRSWVFGTKDEFGRKNVENFDGIPDDALVFETAACERLSSLIFQAADSKYLLGEFDHAVHRVWVRMMNNFLNVTGFEALPVKVWSGQEGVVSYIEQQYSEESTCISASEYTDLARLHKQMLN